MFTRLLFPHMCPVCGRVFEERRLVVCRQCRHKAPRTYFAEQVANPVVRLLWRELHITHGCSFIYFGASEGYRNLIHDFKYGGMWRYAYDLGRWFGKELKKSAIYADVDLVVPVPLHPFKQIQRGYNQSEYMALGIADVLGVKCEVRAVRRVKHNPSQTSKPFEERKANVENIFRVVRPKRLEHHKILLVDDVLTSGATIASCGRAILDSTQDTQLYVATFACALEQEEEKTKTKTKDNNLRKTHTK